MPTDISKIISDAAYQAYERRLLHQVRQAAIPHHVAIIMDGNRRFAREIGLGNVLDGHVKAGTNSRRSSSGASKSASAS